MLYVAAHTDGSILGRVTGLAGLADVGLLALGASRNIAEDTVSIEGCVGAIASRA